MNLPTNNALQNITLIVKQMLWFIFLPTNLQVASDSIKEIKPISSDQLYVINYNTYILLP